MKYRICKNKYEKYKIQKKMWYLRILLIPKFCWVDVERRVTRYIIVADIDEEYDVYETLFDTFIEADNYLIGLKYNPNKDKEKEKQKNKHDVVWTCIGEY